MTVLLSGYGRGSIADLAVLVEKYKPATIADIRWWNKSTKRPEWSGDNLRAIYKDRFYWLRNWGNEARFDGSGEIRIADFYAGLEEARSLPGPILALCACSKAETCHRWVIADKLSVEDNVEIKHIRWPHEDPPGVYWDFRTKQTIKDKLAQLEEWAAKHPEKMDAERTGKLIKMRSDYEMAKRLIMEYLG